MLPESVDTCNGTGRGPEYPGVKVTGTVQMVPDAVEVKPVASTVHPLTVPTAYSCLPPWDCGAAMPVMFNALVS